MVPSDPRALLAILAELEHIRDPQPQQLNRQFKRWVVRGEADLVPVNESQTDPCPIRIQIRDVGWGGLGFISPVLLQPSTMWRVNFLSHEHYIGHQAMIARHCRMVQPGVYLAGGQFCVEAGLLCLLGVDPSQVRQGDKGDNPIASRFLAPGQVA